jgi:hypothetical protein
VLGVGGGVNPLPYWRFGAMSDDPKHHWARHRHIFASTQNINTSSAPKNMRSNRCITPT